MKNNIESVLVTGATGNIGYNFCLAALEAKIELIVLGRKKEDEFRKEFSLPCKYFQWKNPSESLPPAEAMDVDVVIHLMGEPLDRKRWTKKSKNELYTSRVDTTRNLVKSINNSLRRIKLLITASAIGIYGDRGEKTLNENSKKDNDFLAKICKDWEQESQNATCRNAQLRLGLVLDNDSRSLKKMLPFFENGFGGTLSNGKQWMSWIHIHDVVEIIMKIIFEEKFEGAVNVVSPEPIRNKKFTQLLAKSLKTIAILPVPKIVLRVLYGEIAGVILASQKVLPEKVLANNYSFKYKNLAEAFASIFDWKESFFDRLYYQKQWTPKNLEKVFDFFSDERNLEELTPPLLNFKVVGKSTKTLKEGTKIDYKLKIHGIPTKWTSLITNWNPKNEFADVQIKGPYAKWFHRHLFKELAEGVLLEDKVVYRLPLSRFGANIIHWLVRKDIEKIFNYRRSKIRNWS